jgi:hypothetical protein
VVETIASVVLLLGSLASLIAAFSTFRKGKTEAVQAAAALEAAREDRRSETSKLIDEKIKAELDRLYAQVEDQGRTIATQGETIATQGETIRDQAERLERVERAELDGRRANGAIKRAVQRWWDRIRIWDHAGRPGTIPIPSDEDARLLELELEPAIEAVSPVDPDIAV